MKASDKRRRSNRAVGAEVRSCVRACFEALEERRLMSGDITAPSLVIDKPSIDGVTIVDAAGPYFQFGSEDRESRLSSIQWTLTKDGTVVDTATIPLTSQSYGTRIETNPYGVGNFHLEVTASNGDGLTTTADKDLTSFDDDTTAPSVAFDYPRINPVTDAEASGIPFTWGFSADADVATSKLKVTYDPAEGGPTVVLFDGDAPWDATNSRGSYDYFAAAINAGYSGLGTFNAEASVWDKDNDRPNDSLQGSDTHTVTVVDDDTTGPLISFFYPRNHTVCVDDPTQAFDFEILDPDTSQPGEIHIVLTRDADGSLQTIIDKWVNGNHEAYREEIGYVQYGTGVYTLTITASNDDNDRPNDTETTNDTHSVTVVDCHPAPKPAALGDFVWNDIDQDGIQDAGEPGIPAVTVKLYDCTTNALMGTTTTDASGLYQFTNLTPGSYHVEFVAPGGFLFSPQFQGGDNAVDSNANASGVTPCVTLASGETNRTIDAGLYASQPGINIVKLTNGTDNNSPTGPVVAVGSTVTWSYIVTNTGNVPLSNVSVVDDAGTPGSNADNFAPTYVGGDADSDGLLDTTETWTYTASGIAVAGQYENYATVTGKDSTGSTVTDKDLDHYFGATPGIDLVKLTNGTDNNSPTGPVVQAGSTVIWTYIVKNTGNVPLGSVSVRDDAGTPANAADDFNATYVGGDADADGLLDLTETWTFSASGIAVEGQYENFGTAKGTDSTGKTVTDKDVDHYIGYKLAAIGDYVFSDCDGDGVQDADEIGVAGVQVKLLNGSGTVLATTTTNASGLYNFASLTPGVYSVQFVAPAGYRFTSPDQGADDAKDSDANVTTGKTGNYTLASGQVNNTVDAGIWRTRALSGYVYDDVDNDGVKDAMEDGIPGATIRLTDAAGNPVTDANGNVVGPTTTAADGSYSFANLKPGTYRIVETQPAGWNDGKDTVGSLGGSNASNDILSGIIVRSCGDNGVNYNFGEVGILHGLTGTIGWWQNKNGQQQINLLGATSTSLGNWLATNFPNMYGSKAGLNSFANKDRSYVAQRFLQLFDVQGQKLDAQVLAVCLAMFTTTKTLNTSAAGQSWASQHGFKLFDQLTSAGGLYNTQWNVGTNGEAFATKNALGQLLSADGQSLTVWTLLKRTDSFAVNGVLYANGATINGVTYSSTDLRNEANVVFSAINQAGEIYSWM